MRPGIATRALAVVLLLATTASALDYYDLMVRRNHAGEVTVAIGDLGGRAVPPTIIAALVFITAWAKTNTTTAPIKIGATDVVLPLALVLPVAGFSVVSETPTMAVVRAGHLSVQQAASVLTGQALFQLERASPDANWTVTEVVIQ